MKNKALLRLCKRCKKECYGTFCRKCYIKKGNDYRKIRNKNYNELTINILIGVLIFCSLLYVSNQFIMIEGYVKAFDYKNVTIKIYAEDITQERVMYDLNRIPEKYLKGLYVIRYHNNEYFCTKRYCGYYNAFFKEIRVCCGFETLIHELAHHKNNMDRGFFISFVKHGDKFQKALKEINSSVWRDKNGTLRQMRKNS